MVIVLMACDQLILKEFFSMLKRHFTDKQASSLQDYVELTQLSVMLEYNSCSNEYIYF